MNAAPALIDGPTGPPQAMVDLPAAMPARGIALVGPVPPALEQEVARLEQAVAGHG